VYPDEHQYKLFYKSWTGP